jgi:thiol-disulfide isomerase/thioredoxin
MKSFLAAGILIFALASCNPEKKEMSGSLKTGTWRATIEIQGQQLPFNFELVKDENDGYDIYIRNAEERLLLDEVNVKNDSVTIGLHIFDADIKAKISGDTLKGEFIKNYEKDYNVPFLAVYGQGYRFEKGKNEGEIPDFSGTYEVVFSNESDTTEAVGVFKQQGDSVTGTFLTATGDYRYLQGNVANGRLQLSTFDGNHAYIFTASKEADGKLSGEYYSGKTWSQFWTGIKNDKAKLPDPESLTYLKEGFEKIEFSFPDVNGKNVSLADEKYKNKVVILQLFGTWCPNCMDETKFLAPWYNENKNRGVEIIGLAYERKPDFDYASTRVKKMIGKLDVSYDFVIAGTNDKAAASQTLPMLNKVAAFPTTIFIGRDGKVKKIHTGFSGPGTGLYYDQFIQHFNETVNELLSDKLSYK